MRSYQFPTPIADLRCTSLSNLQHSRSTPGSPRTAQVVRSITPNRWLLPAADILPNQANIDASINLTIISDCDSEGDNENIDINEDEDIENLDINEPDENETININEEQEDDETDEIEIENLDLKECLKIWSLVSNVDHKSLRFLLRILRTNCDASLPKDPRTLLKTPKKPAGITNITGGQLWYQGIKTCLMKKFRTANLDDNISTLSLKVYIDGLPLHRSTNLEFWPILASIDELPNEAPLKVGIYCGLKHPQNIEEYLRQLVDELKELTTSGIVIHNRFIKINLLYFIADTPARALLKGVVNFNGLQGCIKCTCQGTKENNRTIFRGVSAEQRTNKAFRDGDYMPEHQRELTPLLELECLDMIKQFIVADELHLIHHGVFKKLIKRWRDGERGFLPRWSDQQCETISSKLADIQLPSEIHRRLRHLKYLDKWKATEFRSFLHYGSIVVLRDNISDEQYSHFMLLFCSITLLSSKAYEEHWPKAGKMLNRFVMDYETNYGPNGLTSNVHNLQHVLEDVKNYGPLPLISTYSFENELRLLKLLLRSGVNCLQQVINRLAELDQLDNRHKNTEENIKYPCVKHHCDKRTAHIRQGLMLQQGDRNGWFLTKDNHVVRFESAVERASTVVIKGKKASDQRGIFLQAYKFLPFEHIEG
ncbi:uncharacterized protein LOC133395040 isoform X2 [Anopheles gambiae]|uniref:uncharacterized protein LOC133395040 isoform X2 n=1 Tax=Anopheles gambiae TaxID=7165 RepID=UPI002AC91C13|nr:uncharacterized protein LOC133395040 isoform X2 [Anopheles gambiae]XP_061519273.1 uncharacterized protein LOC133395040 isoform X2 [Anopheles gambiae]XP_061519279.1 uncharacterized protein LOC133395040 isoform X2 [Anopheles gambiae]